MALLGFKKVYMERILSGEKTTTIRAPRKYPVKVGETLYLYVGLRTKGCRKLGEAEALEVKDIIITDSYDIVEGWNPKNKRFLSIPEMEELVVKDGFDSPEAFFKFFDENHGLPLHANLISWGKTLKLEE